VRGDSLDLSSVGLPDLVSETKTRCRPDYSPFDLATVTRGDSPDLGSVGSLDLATVTRGDSLDLNSVGSLDQNARTD
jgi:hypothetical protein